MKDENGEREQPMLVPPPPWSYTKAFYCTPVSHDFPQLGHGLSCVCGRQWLHWIPNDGDAHAYTVRDVRPADYAVGKRRESH